MISFDAAYSRNLFVGFLRDFLPDDTEFLEQNISVETSFKDINKITVIGKNKGLNNLTIIEIDHNFSENSRSAQTREIFRFLSKNLYSNVLLITFNKKEEVYRFSLVLSDLEWKNEKTVKKVFSNPKRLSFILGLNSKIYTPKSQLINLGKVKNFSDLHSRFDIEVVSEEFYEKYKNLYEKLVGYFEKDKNFNNFSKKYKVNINLLSKKILGQITFCYFLQKKGWLGANKNEDFYKGSKNFLREKFNDVIKEKKNYFNDFLEYLFYDGLNNDKNIENFFNVNLNCKIPFLNGGLFEPLNDYKWKEENLNIPNTLFSNENGDGILDVFELFNFTVDENQSIESDLAVDPEMLGKVYERLIDEALKKKYRPFYTHREVVNYMCTISLIKFLEKKFSNNLSFNDFEKLLIDTSNFILTGEKIKKDKNDDKYNKFLNELDNELSQILICDPAIGSGAFPVAMMNLITNIREFISVNLGQNKSRYELKYNFIKNSIHGVDIDTSAVEIAKLRLWLSLIIEEINIKKTSALPNLQYRIVQGDSLVESYSNFYFRYDLENIEQRSLLEDDNIQEEFKDLIKNQDEFYKSIYTSKKNKLKEKIKSQMEKIVFSTIEKDGGKKDKKNLLKEKFSKSLETNNYHNFFHWRLVFANVFFTKKGFDIIIGNPPYTESRSKDFDEDKKKLYLKEIKNKWNDEKMITKGSDLMTYFFPLSVELLNDFGINTLITSNSWLSTNYGKNLQNFLIEKTHMQEIVDSDFRYFPKGKGPDVNTIISILSLKKNNLNQDLKYIKIKDRFNSLDSFELQNRKNIYVKKFNYDDHKLKTFKWGLLFDSENWLIDIFKDLQLSKKPEYYSIGQGLNLSKEFIVERNDVERLNLDKKILIPFSSKETLYSCYHSNNFLINKKNCSKKDIKVLEIEKIKTFDPSSTSKKPPKLFLPRGVSDKHYCTLNLNDSFTDSAVDIYFNKEFGNYEERLLNFWVFLNSSIFKLYRELSGRKSLGGGLLKAEATDLINLNIYHELKNFKKIDKLFQIFKEKEVENIEDTLNNKDYLDLDDIVMNHLKISKYSEKIRKLLLDKVNLRHKKSTT